MFCLLIHSRFVPTQTRDPFILGLATIQGGVKILINIEKIFLEDGTHCRSDKTGTNSTRKRMTMNHWTISRRVIAGFAAMLLIIVTLGVFALWRLMGLAEDIVYVADNSVPSILTLREAANISRDNLILLLQIDPSDTTDRNSVLEQKISTNGARRDELIKSYESLISDAEDRRLYEKIKRTSDVARASRRG